MLTRFLPKAADSAQYTPARIVRLVAFVVAAIVFVAVIRPDDLADSRDLVAIVDATGAVQVVAFSVDGDITTVAQAPAAPAGVVSVSYGDGLIMQILVDGKVRVLNNQGGELQEHVVWAGHADPAGRAVASTEYESSVAFLLPSGMVRANSVGLDRPARVELWPIEGLDTVDVSAIGALFFFHTADDRIVALNPEEPALTQEILNSTTPIRKLTTSGDRLLVLLDDDTVHEYDFASGVWTVLFETTETAALAGPADLDGGWFTIDHQETLAAEITDGIRSVTVPAGTKIVSVHGQGNTLVALTATGDVLAYNLAVRPEPISITPVLSTELQRVGIISSSEQG